MNIALMGFRGTDKTAICKLLAKKLDKKLISTDDEILKKTNIRIEKFVKKYGWNKFCNLESEVIEKLSDLDDCIFDTGDSIAIRNEDIINLKKNSLIILLTADIKTITSRLKGAKKFHGKYWHIDEIKDLLQECESRRKKAADYIIDTSSLSPEEVCDLIMHYVQTELQ